MLFSAVLLLGVPAVLGANNTMRAAFYPGYAYKMEVRDVATPTIINATDAVVRITTAAICGTDLHTYHGLGFLSPHTIGHEGVGYVTAVGSAVSSLRVGQYVALPDQPGLGHLSMGPWRDSKLFYGANWGVDLTGLQAEYARVPFADDNLIPLPITKENTTRALEQSYTTISDIFPTAWTALDYAGFMPGDKVVVFGAGPVGLLVAYSAHLRGASRIYVVDSVDARLKRAAEISPAVVPISNVKTSNSSTFSDPAVAAILALEPGGVTRVVDAVGFEAVDPATGNRDQGAVLRSALEVVESGGGVGQVGVYHVSSNDGTNDDTHANVTGVVQFPLARFWEKGVSLRGGGVDPVPVASALVDMIASGVADPGSVVKSAEIGIEDVPEYYGRFSRHEEIKVYVHFP